MFLSGFFTGAFVATGIQCGGITFVIKYVHKLLPSNISFPIIFSLTIIQIVGRVVVKNVEDSVKQFKLVFEKVPEVPETPRRPRQLPETLTSSLEKDAELRTSSCCSPNAEAPECAAEASECVTEAPEVATSECAIDPREKNLKNEVPDLDREKTE